MQYERLVPVDSPAELDFSSVELVSKVAISVEPSNRSLSARVDMDSRAGDRKIGVKLTGLTAGSNERAVVWHMLELLETFKTLQVVKDRVNLSQAFKVVLTKGTKSVSEPEKASIVDNHLRLDLKVDPDTAPKSGNQVLPRAAMFKDLTENKLYVRFHPGQDTKASLVLEPRLRTTSPSSSNKPELFTVADASELRKSPHKNMSIVNDFVFTEHVKRLFT